MSHHLTVSLQKLGILLLVFGVASVSLALPSQAVHSTPSATPATTIINSNVTTDTTWTLANSPYHVTTHIAVESDVTLTIEPGVEIWIGDNLYFGIYEGASVIAKGTPSQHITISRYVDPETGAGPRWKKMWFYENTTSYFRYVDFSYGGAKSSGDDALLYFADGGNHTLNNCTVAASKQNAIVAQGDSLNLTIAGTEVYGNGRYAMIIDNGANVDVTGSTFGVGDSRIWIRNRGEPVSLAISDSNLTPDAGFYSVWNDMGDFVCVDAQNNWWGAANGPRDSSNYGDACDLGANAGGGSATTDGVDYRNWLTAQAPLAGITTPPSASLSVTPDPTVPQPPGTEYLFTASDSSDAEDYASSLEVCWDWDNSGYCDVYDSGRYTTAKSTVHVFDSVDGMLQTVRLVVRDTDGDTDEVTQDVQLNGPPTAAFTMNQSSWWARVDFDASGSSDDVDPVEDLQVAWDYHGDGTLDVDYTLLKTANHNYAHLGRYWPTAYVKDTGGLVDSQQKSVNIIPPAASGTFTDSFSLESVDGTVVTSMSPQNSGTLLLNGLAITHTPWLTLPYSDLPGVFIYQGFTLNARSLPQGTLIDQVEGTYTITVQYGYLKKYFEGVLKLPFEEHLELYHWTEATQGLWLPVDATLDMTNQRLTAAADTFGHFALAMDLHQIYLPIVVR